MNRISRAPLIIVYAIALHLLYGFLLLTHEVPPAVGLIGGYDWLLDFAGPESAGMFLIVMATMAAVALAFGNRVNRLESAALLLPQYSVQLYAFLSGAAKILTGFDVVNSQGVVVSVPFATIAAALGPIMIAAALHTIALAVRFADPFYDYDRAELIDELKDWKARALYAEQLQLDRERYGY